MIFGWVKWGILTSFFFFFSLSLRDVWFFYTEYVAQISICVLYCILYSILAGIGSNRSIFLSSVKLTLYKTLIFLVILNAMFFWTYFHPSISTGWRLHQLLQHQVQSYSHPTGDCFYIYRNYKAFPVRIIMTQNCLIALFCVKQKVKKKK